MSTNPYNQRLAAKLAREEREMQVADRRTRRVEKERAARTERTMKLDTWYDFHGDRLGCDRAYLESAVLNGWTGDQIEALDVQDAGRLAGPPPADS